jgi:type I restriction enzyme M protein
MMDIRPHDKIIDPACGTGGFLVEAFLAVITKNEGRMSDASARTWAHRQVYGVDKDAINVKLARAIMVSLGDGSVNIHIGDSIREDRWAKDYPHLMIPLTDGSFTVVITNPPFGKNLKVSKIHLRRNRYSIAAAAAAKKREDYVDLEIGLVFIERAYRLLMKGGRLGIILPETYFFSATYWWLPDWLRDRFILRGVLNIPMEALPRFLSSQDQLLRLREKVILMVYKPAWFRDGEVFISYAPTVGINKDGEELFIVDPVTGTRTSKMNDKLAEDVHALVNEYTTTDTSRWVRSAALTDRLIAVPVYFDERALQELDALMALPEMSGFTSKTIGELTADRMLEIMNGHGSPSADFRTGQVPYIKVSDIRAGQININPTNRVPEVVAERFWKKENSGLRAYDLITPIRTSKNIGEFVVLMPGQERVVLTKEVLVLRAADDAPFDNFYLLWAMTLKAVRRQWDRIVFMQTNREDVGRRYNEIRIPVPPNPEVAYACSQTFRDYYIGTQQLRDNLLEYLARDSKHYIFMSSVAVIEEALDEEIAEPEDES